MVWSERGQPKDSLRLTAARLLQIVAGDAVVSTALIAELAVGVLELAEVRAAHLVLAGGPLAVGHAIDLAKLILRQVDDGSGAAAL